MTSPSSLGPDDLIAAHYTLAGVDRHGVARTPFPERVAAAGAAGFAGIGIQPADYLNSKHAGLSDATMKAVLDGHGVVLAEIDGAPWWPDPTMPAEVFRDAQDLALRLADTFGARHLIAPVPIIPEPLPPLDQLAEWFGQLCDRASSYGLLVGLEFLPWAPITDAGGAWALVREAARANGGVTVDFWHHCVGSDDDDLLRAIPAERVNAVHFTDGVRNRELDLLAETTVGRRLPGEGEFPVERVLRTLDDIGAQPPITVEIVSIAHRRLPPDELARVVHDAVRAAIDRVRQSERREGLDRT
jgi:sugar phosphate isomerase/epimerase